MAAPNYSAQGWVARTLSRARAIVDGNLSDVTGPRMGRYQEQMMLAPMIGEPVLCDEGALMMSSTLPGATALQLGISAAFSAVNPAFVFKNNAPAGPSSPRCHLRDIHFILATAGTSGTNFLYATALDNVNRGPTTVSALGTAANGTAYLAPVNCTNIDENPAAVGQCFFPQSTAAGTPIVVPAAGSSVRYLYGNGQLRTTIVVVGDEYRIVFGSTDRPTVTVYPPATIARITDVHPAVTIGPQEFFLLYLWSASNITAGNALASIDVTWFER